jgi:hypothetical protein
MAVAAGYMREWHFLSSCIYFVCPHFTNIDKIFALQMFRGMLDAAQKLKI